jgi:acyl carrier protein
MIDENVSVTEVVINIISKVINREMVLAELSISRNDIESWDSLAHMEIIFSCEEYFKIEFSQEEMYRLLSASNFIDILADKIK